MPTKTWSVSASGDDCHFRRRISDNLTDVWTVTPNEIFVGKGGNIYLCGAVRFRGVDIPKGVPITSAKLRFYTYSTSGVVNNRVVRAKIDAEANINPQPFTTDADYVSRSRTVNRLLWDDLPAWNNGTWNETPDISNMIQELVNRADWAGNNSIVLFIEDNGSDGLAARMWLGYSFGLNAAQLVVSYSVVPVTHTVQINSNPVAGVSVAADNVTVGVTPLSIVVQEGSHSFAVPSSVTV